MDEIIFSSEPNVIQNHLLNIQTSLNEITDNLPDAFNQKGELVAKNPVWIYPTESTNFLRIQSDVNTLSKNIEKISFVPKDSSAYHTGMLDVNSRAIMIKENILDATPYLYSTPQTILSNTVWLIGMMGLAEVLLRKTNPNNI